MNRRTVFASLAFLSLTASAQPPTMSVTIPAHGSEVYFITGTRQDKQMYQAEEAWLHDYQNIENRNTARPAAGKAADQGEYVAFLGDKDSNYLEWRDVYVSKGGKYKLSIAYATAKDRDLDITVNGKKLKKGRPGVGLLKKHNHL